MADDKNVAAGKRFSRDMRRIREDQEVSIDDIHNDTRIARTLIQSFEEGGLYEHPTFNRVYLRSFVRAYAETVEISSDSALEGLDAALDGTYENDLAVKYLGEDPARHDEVESSEPADTERDEGGAEEDGSDEESNRQPTSPAGPDGRGGIVGPPREMKGDGDSESQRSEESAPHADSQDESGAQVSPEPTDSEHAEEEAEDGIDETSDESDQEIPVDETEEKPESESDASASDESSREAPSWFDSDSEESSSDRESESGAPGQRDAPPRETGRASTDEKAPAAGGLGGSGIVGEPTEMGSGGSVEGTSSIQESPSEPHHGEAPHGEAPRGRRDRSTWFGFEQREVLMATIGIVVVVLVLIGLGFAFFSTDPAPSEGASTASADTTATPVESPDTTESVADQKPPPANISLGETIYMTILATGKVEEIRIQRDDDLRRPYWIEEGDAEVYPFQRRITLENELSDIELYVQAYPFPIPPQDTTGRVEITRADLEAFADTLRGQPAALSVVADTIPKGEPVPAE